MLKQQLPITIKTLADFTRDALGLNLDTSKNTGFDYVVDLLEASAYNTYLETMGDKCDSLYRRIKESRSDLIIHSYLTTIKLLSKKLNLKQRNLILAFDYTDEDFYGDVQGFFIHGAPKKDKRNGKFKFLTCNLVSDEIKQRIPLLSVPIKLGHNMSREVLYILQLLNPYLGDIELLLFDRGFYSKELMLSLSNAQYNYLIFVPKDSAIKKQLDQMTVLERKLIPYNFEYSGDKTKHKGQTYLAFLKEIYSKTLDLKIDWVFSTNIEKINLDEIIKTYKKRWRIENSFKVQDDALLKTKSTNIKIRFFIFVFQQMLESLWYCFYKHEVTFKRFIIEISKKSIEMQVKHKARKESED